jgi:hypothetical protein
MQSTKPTSSMTAPGKLAIHITCGLAVLLTFSRLTLRKTSRLRPPILRLRVRAADARHHMFLTREAGVSIKSRTPAEMLGWGPRPGAERSGTPRTGRIVGTKPAERATAKTRRRDRSIGSRCMLDPLAIARGSETLSPASRAQSYLGVGTWGLRPRLYAFACSAGLDQALRY